MAWLWVIRQIGLNSRRPITRPVERVYSVKGFIMFAAINPS